MSGVCCTCMYWSYRLGSPHRLISRLHVSVVNPSFSPGTPHPASPPPVLLSPPHHHLHRWVLLFPHRILIMAIEGFQRGRFTPFAPAPRLHGVMMQVVAKGGEWEDLTSKKTTANANKDLLCECLSASFWIHEVFILCWLLISPKHGWVFMKCGISSKEKLSDSDIVFRNNFSQNHEGNEYAVIKPWIL